ncbi:MAG: phosphatidate cytidylyltransferase [Bacteroidota bacterium]|jgi:phosphatidate cytidylyltransferase|nr:phosphatidate cytidylyltransferase [Bacteroidota bacterium]
MAFDTQTFKTRTLTAIVFAIVMLTGLLWNKWSFIVLFTLIHFGCWYEFIKLLQKIYPENFKSRIPLGLFYITLPFILLIILRVAPVAGKDDNFLKIVPCGIIFSIWINDTMAYIVGSFIGKNPLSKISPKKTWEGTIGGILLCVITISLIGKAIGIYSLTDWMIIALCSSVFGTFGDLLESKIKRMASVKDSGNFMPGHGGFLDRFDSLLIVIPFVSIYYFLFMR